MTSIVTRCRIVAIRLLKQINRNPEYAQHIGVSVVNGKTKNTEARYKQRISGWKKRK